MRKLDLQPSDRLVLQSIQLIERRRFVALLAAALATVACGRTPQNLLEPSSADNLRRQQPSSTTPDVSARDFGATGDGFSDETAAINSAICSLGPNGGVVRVPDGVYLIDPVKSIQLTSNVTLSLEKKAVLRAIASGSGTSAVIRVRAADKATIQGGSIIGERFRHFGTTGEWGMGIKVLGSSNVRIDGVEVSDCWGDGIYVGGVGVGGESRNIVISNCVGRNNRRQGLSITGCLGALIDKSNFTDTNGTAPAAGIDLEPNANMRVTDVIVRDCLVARNSGYGLLLVGDGVTNVRLESNRCIDNACAGVYLVRGANGTTIYKNKIERNGTHGVLFEDAHYNDLESNVIRDNSLRSPNTFSNVRLAAASSHNTMDDNQFGVARLLDAPMPNIVITDDCTDNVIQATTSGSRTR